MTKAIVGELQNLRKLFNEVVIVDIFCCNDKEAAKSITLRRFCFIEMPLVIIGLLLFGAILAMFS